MARAHVLGVDRLRERILQKEKGMDAQRQTLEVTGKHLRQKKEVVDTKKRLHDAIMERYGDLICTSTRLV
jgi:hypothetical protein